MSLGRATNRENLPWVEKYRPTSLDEVYGQNEIVNTVRKFVEEGKLPHLLFYGPPGTGKTSTIIALAKEIYGKNYHNMVLELNASDDRGIDVVRNQVKDFASTRQIFSKGFKLIILDEADAMTNAAQNSLRRIIEKYTKNTRFCILANYAYKLTPALLSRCTRFRFQPIGPAAIEQRMNNVIIKENIKIDDAAKKALLKVSKGDMRRVLNVLQASKAAVEENEEITEELIYDCCGMCRPGDVKKILKSILEEDFTSAYYTMNKICQEKGVASVDIIEEIVLLLEEYELQNEETRIEMLTKLSDIEYAISKGGNTKVVHSAIISAIKTSFENESTVAA
ncbi:hypothetical protein Kpol_1066p38 [Vanderwaltozyma polyspora DSM 70294]|uniref:AAA+ ATPase domain-containing protein n=1 Tax=Vanderwaltozyma polyspora (strain ATCC 22028 / DSM 70294 / BCRC 21397 / CBS 2163 / NBRC 10782 / NRRL Y-8283 / UCD 57-17) TaxID=436907 RepID=A7TMQ7_VANPO|nr:uncharacterized protein Kpol_1066p38 [Vanderwaltozyma polyspora DSM 70294]EDO16471.1 hypothetical protein Kpol_1066p38 [Vanderwaltozyma polyspora DSM 70294]